MLLPRESLVQLAAHRLHMILTLVCVQRGGNLSRDEIHVIQHALDMTSKTGLCPGAMTPLDKVGWPPCCRRT